MILGMHHIAISVSDMDTALTFYRDLLGFAVVQEAEWNRDAPLADQAIGLPESAARMSMLKAGNAHIELFQYSNPPSEDRRARPCDHGYTHFALQVEDIQAEHSRLLAGGRFRNQFRDLRQRSFWQRHRTL